MDIITKFLASLLDKLKVKNPLIFVLVQGLLLAVFTGLNDGTIALNGLPEWVTSTLVWLIGSIIALTGPRTVSILSGDHVQTPAVPEEKKTDEEVHS